MVEGDEGPGLDSIMETWLMSCPVFVLIEPQGSGCCLSLSYSSHPAHGSIVHLANPWDVSFPPAEPSDSLAQVYSVEHLLDL